MGINKEIITKKAGDDTDVAQVFVENTIVDLPIRRTDPFAFEVPVYTIQGATFQYYTQNTDGISGSLNNNKTLLFNFSANTQTILDTQTSSGVTQMVHDVYRLKYDIFNDIVLNPTGTTLLNEALSALTQPITTIVEDLSANTFLVVTVHTTNFPVLIKPKNEYTQNLMLDKAQYFVDSKFLFTKPVDITVGEVQNMSAETLYVVPTGSTEMIYSSSRQHQITGTTFIGTEISGCSFTYFVPPQKPDIDVIDGVPSVIGAEPTFAPIFSFNNVDDGDYYKLQVNYDTGDTKFTGITSIFEINKQLGDAEFIRTAGKTLTPNKDFLYRIGNTKEIINLFGVKQSITTWSRYEAAQTANNGSFALSGYTYRSIIGGPPLQFTQITATTVTSFSTIDVGSDTITDPNLASSVSSPLGGGIGSQVVAVSDVNGYYEFIPQLAAGTYLITAENAAFSYPQYYQTTITLLANTQMDFVFGIVWGNTTIPMGDTIITFI